MAQHEASGQVTHKPYVSASTILAELRPLPLIVGTVLGIVFGAASLYLALKIGLTISASIPIAVLSISIFRWISRAFGTRPATILENNIVQTTGSAGESIAFGVAVTMPALMILGHDMDVARTVTVAVLGGLLGILMMIPLRRGLIVKEHGKLAYPEGTACAEVLIAGEKGGTNAKTVFTGLGLGFLFKFLNGEGGLSLLKNTPGRDIPFYKGGSVATECSPELMGVGYIIGPRIASIMCAGGVLAYLVLIPAIKLFGEHLPAPLAPETDKLIADMKPNEIRNAYILYIGAGAVATGGIISMLRALPTIAAAFARGLGSIAAGKGAGNGAVERTDRDLPMGFVVFGCLALVAALMLLPSLQVSFLSAVLILVFGFLFVTVSSRLTGEIGSSSNPISGMTVATLLLTCLVFVALGRTGPLDRVAALSIAAVVCIAASNGGTTSQDLKTGFLVGGTPRSQQIGILIGALTAALVIGFTLQLFNDSKTIFAAREFAGVKVEQRLFEGKQTLHGPDAERDSNAYNVVHFTADNAPEGVPPGKYFVDDAGSIRYLVDPGINGVLGHRDPTPADVQAAAASGKEAMGAEVQKFDAPKAKLMSLIIDGVLGARLPWGLVLIGAFIAITLELAGVSSLPFAVGVYLPISASTPIFVGGAIRWLVDRRNKKKQSEAESESAPGVLLSSGLIAGGALAGMMLAIIAGISTKLAETLALPARLDGMLGTLPERLGRPFYDPESKLGPFMQLSESNIAVLCVFAVLGAFLYVVGRERLLARR
jgi:putative OPT family oligopeptide transporter